MVHLQAKSLNAIVTTLGNVGTSSYEKSIVTFDMAGITGWKALHVEVL